MILLSIIEIEDSLGVVLPAEILDKLGVGVGDAVTVRETEDGYEITSHSADIARQVAIAETVMEDSRETLRRLAQGPP